MATPLTQLYGDYTMGSEIKSAGYLRCCLVRKPRTFEELYNHHRVELKVYYIVCLDPIL